MNAIIKSGVVVALVAFMAVPATASIRYEFTAHSSFEGISGSLSYTSPNFISDNRFVPVASLDSCTVTTPVGGACTFSMPFFADTTVFGGADTYDFVGFQVAFSQPAYYFANGAFGALGIYETLEFGSAQAATLIVSQVGGVPEPATWAMMIGGFGLVGSAARRRRRISEPA